MHFSTQKSTTNFGCPFFSFPFPFLCIKMAKIYCFFLPKSQKSRQKTRPPLAIYIYIYMCNVWWTTVHCTVARQGATKNRTLVVLRQEAPRTPALQPDVPGSQGYQSTFSKLGSTPTPWSGPFRDHSLRPWSQSPLTIVTDIVTKSILPEYSPVTNRSKSTKINSQTFCSW